MTVAVDRIAFDQFRSYDHFELSGIGRLTVLVGENAVGKTNAVEGIQLVTALSSFRRPRVADLVKEGERAARVEASLSGGGRLLEVSLEIEGGMRRYRLNGKPKRAADLKGTAPAVSFSPDDLLIAKGGGSARRAAIDDLGGQLSPRYLRLRSDYGRVVRQKNRLLKEGAPDELLASANDMVVLAGSQMTAYRSALVSRLAPIASSRYGELSGAESFTMAYRPSWDRLPPASHGGHSDREAADAGGGGSPVRIGRDDAASALRAAIDQRAAEERARRRAVVGPHTDDVSFLLDGRDASTFASQGQQRSIVLALKLAEASLIEEMLHARPILLLDDVMSELDARRREALSAAILDGMQSFVTTTNLSYFSEEVLAAADVVELPRGRRRP